MKIRKAANKDIKRISKIFRTEYGKPPYNEKWSEKGALKKIKEYFKDKLIFVAEVEKELAGFIIMGTHYWDDGLKGIVDEIVVSSSFQGKGFGKEMMGYSENHLRKKGIKILALFSNKRSKAFKIYKRLGFKEKDLVYMEKRLK